MRLLNIPVPVLVLVFGSLQMSVVGAQPQPFELRLGSGEKVFERYKEYGYNAALIGGLTQLATFDSVCPGAIAQGAPLRERIGSQREKFEQQYEHARALGLEICLGVDEVSLPVPVFERLQKSGVVSGIDYDNPDFWQIYRAKYREVLKAFPEVAFVMVRTGENYSHPEEGYIGRTVWQGKYDEIYFRHMRRLIEETRKLVVDEFGRTLIWRTWDLGNSGFHASPAVFDRVLEGVTNRKGLILSIKYTQTDFWCYNDFNPMIGRGSLPQIVEFECAREYEGKGAFPDYVGPEHAEAMRKARELGAKGVWVWDSGGGWGGPFLKSDRWLRLNVEATSRLAQNPELSPRALAEEWAAKEFGTKAAAKVADIMMRSPECIRKSMYVEAYARSHRGWLPSLNLLRDDIIRGPIKSLYAGAKQALPEVLREKEEAMQLATRMRTDFESVKRDVEKERGQQVYDEALSSLIYLESLTKVTAHYVSGMFLYYHWQETGQQGEGKRAKRELMLWRSAWQEYQSSIPKLPGAASPYRSQNSQEPDSAKEAMADVCEQALQKLSKL